MGGFGSEIPGVNFAKFFGASGGVAATFSAEFSLSTLGPVGGFGSESFGGFFARYVRASGWVWQQIFHRNCL